MEDFEKLSIEELINGYLDGELSERQVTQVKRLMAHDEKFSKKVQELSRQRELLAAIPREKAPEHLLDDIKSRLERKVLLHEYTSTNGSYKSLIIRHLSSLAAVIVLVIGLGFVVWQVFAPVEPENNQILALSNDKLSGLNTAANKSEVKAPPKPVLVSNVSDIDEVENKSDGKLSESAVTNNLSTVTLDIKVDNIVTANKVLAQAVYSNSLLDEVMVKRNNKNVDYTISAPAERIADFFTKAKAIWPLSKRNKLILYNDSQKMLAIDNVTYPELREFVLRSGEISPDAFIANVRLARRLDSELNSLNFIRPQYCADSGDAEFVEVQSLQGDVELASRDLGAKKRLSFKIRLSEEN